MELSKKFFQIANIVVPIVLLIILSLLSLGQGDYLEIFEPAGYESLTDPINFAFAIWGPIFFFLIIFLIFQARDLFKSDEEKIEMPYVEQVHFTFILSTVMASLWYISWLYRIIWLATLSMIIYLVFLLIGYLRLDINLKERPRNEQIAVVVPWSLYTGWITAATIVSTTTFFESIGLGDLGLLPESVWAILIILIAGMIYLAVLFTRNDYIYTAVGIWTLIGILSQRLVSSPIIIEVVITAIIGIVLLSAGIIYRVVSFRLLKN
ncbi:MAG: conserved membrane protein of unknown function [Promethearchaeota archaeon]|nr:MAG: conserved membrane protein of unknown function [Candidatus Lokiarchaeota archaeon]